MEATLLGLAMPNVLRELKKMLVRQGFIVQTMPTSNPIIVAHRKKSWWRKSRQLVFEMISVDSTTTRVEITAIVNDKKDSRYEGVIEGSVAAAVSNVFKRATYGF